MHEVSWRRVKWPRPSWVRKDLLSVCGIVLGSIAVSRQYLLRAVGASWKPLWGDLLGPLGGLRGLILALLTQGAPGPLLAAPRALLGGLGAPLGRSWRLLAAPPLLGPPWGPLGGSWAAPGALLAPPKRLLELPRRLQSRSLPKSQNSSTVQRFSVFFGPPGAHLAPPEALLGLSWRPLGPSWRLLGGLSGVGRLWGGSWQG